MIAAQDLLALEPDCYARVVPHARSCFLVRRPNFARASARAFGRNELAFCSCGSAGRLGGHLVVPGHNIVTNAGDQFYAQKGCGETPTNFATFRQSLTSAEGTPGKTSNFSNLTTVVGTKACDSGFPKTNDNAVSPLNPGTVDIDVIAYRVTWTTAEAVATITGLAMHANGATGTDPILNLARFASSFAKTNLETLVTWANHRFNGV